MIFVEIWRSIDWRFDSEAERKKGLYLDCSNIKLMIIKENSTRIVSVRVRNCYLWDINQFIVRWNGPVERIPHNEQCFVVCHHAYCWLDSMETYDRNSCTPCVHCNLRNPSCRCEVSGFSVSDRQIFPREAVC